MPTPSASGCLGFLESLHLFMEVLFMEFYGVWISRVWSTEFVSRI